MKIRTKLILNYSILTTILLVLFSIVVLIFYANYRQKDFNTRLTNRAKSSVSMLLKINNVDTSMLRLIDNNIITAMGELKIVILDTNMAVVYSNVDMLEFQNKNNAKINLLAETFKVGKKKIEFFYTVDGQTYKILASAIDNQGMIELSNLFYILLWVLAISVLFIIGFGFYNAKWSLRPFKHLIHEVETHETQDLKKRLSSHGHDEISQLSDSFNKLLDRIEHTIENEKAFITNASHELRTPVTSVMGQIEVALNNERTNAEYKNILSSVYEDTSHMASLINGFLDLAQADIDFKKLEIKEVEIDELLFSIVDELKKRKPHYSISIEFAKNPEAENQLACLASERLLKIMFTNIIDNACKFSNNNKAKVKIDFNKDKILVSIIDYGIGIQKDELENIFKPLFRGSNVTNIPGYGIGLTIVKRIAELHNASLTIDSQFNIGTTVIIELRIH